MTITVMGDEVGAWVGIGSSSGHSEDFDLLLFLVVGVNEDDGALETEGAEETLGVSDGDFDGIIDGVPDGFADGVPDGMEDVVGALVLPFPFPPFPLELEAPPLPLLLLPFPFPVGTELIDGINDTDGVDEGILEGSADGVRDGSADGVVDGISEGAADGAIDSDGPKDGAADSDGASDPFPFPFPLNPTVPFPPFPLDGAALIEGAEDTVGASVSFNLSHFPFPFNLLLLRPSTAVG